MYGIPHIDTVGVTGLSLLPRTSYGLLAGFGGDLTMAGSMKV